MDRICKVRFEGDSRLYRFRYEILREESVRDIVEKTNILEEYPGTGRKAPEIGDENVREIFAYSYRILYEIKSDKVYIIGIIHGRRDFISTHVYGIKEPNNRS